MRIYRHTIDTCRRVNAYLLQHETTFQYLKDTQLQNDCPRWPSPHPRSPACTRQQVPESAPHVPKGPAERTSRCPPRSGGDGTRSPSPGAFPSHHSPLWTVKNHLGIVLAASSGARKTFCSHRNAGNCSSGLKLD